MHSSINLNQKNLVQEFDSVENHCDNFSFRIINPLEVEHLTDEALFHLLDLKQNFCITEELFEEVLIDVSSIFGILDLECLKDLLKCRGVDTNKIIN